MLVDDRRLRTCAAEGAVGGKDELEVLIRFLIPENPLGDLEQPAKFDQGRNAGANWFLENLVASPADAERAEPCLVGYAEQIVAFREGANGSAFVFREATLGAVGILTPSHYKSRRYVAPSSQFFHTSEALPNHGLKYKNTSMWRRRSPAFAVHAMICDAPAIAPFTAGLEQAARLGAYCWNREVGSKTLGIASFNLRAVCMNRNLWGVKNFGQITIRHTKCAAQRFAHEAAPALTSFANSSPASFVAGIKAARERIVARTDEDRESFLRRGGFSKSETAKIIETVLGEEDRKLERIFDFVQASPPLLAARLIRTHVLS